MTTFGLLSRIIGVAVLFFFVVADDWSTAFRGRGSLLLREAETSSLPVPLLASVLSGAPRRRGPRVLGDDLGEDGFCRGCCGARGGDDIRTRNLQFARESELGSKYQYCNT